MGTTLLGIRKLTKLEKTSTDADLVFMREDENGKLYNIFVCLPHFINDMDSWHQFGNSDDILKENVTDIQNYLQQQNYTTH